uniref:VWFA domain-containing protein n=1 Tax=Acrobeloides nanus TaxID=290746 RepID=A0A914DVU2_9BILA
MQRQLVLVALLASVTFSYVVKVQDSKPNSFYTPSDNSQCSTNASRAYFDVILVIDNSVNMGASNLRKISNTLSLSLSKFPIGNQIDITQGQRNVRIAVVTFDNQATIVANYTDINSVNDLTRILNGITASNTQGGNLAEGLNKAFYIQTNCTNPLNGCEEGYNYMRPTAMMIFAAYVNPVSVQNVTVLVKTLDVFDDGTPIGVNFNTANQDVTSLLNLITFNEYVNASMYNFTGSSSTLTRDLEWAMLQVWKSYGCDPSMTGLHFSLCQGPACDATTTICCAECYYCEINPNCGIFPKKKSMKKRSKKDRLIRKMAKVNGRMVRVA